MDSRTIWLWTVWFFVLCPVIVRAQDTNVLSYYAVSNSIDGQPLINKTNVLRFFPVFALRDSTHSVKVTVYYGNKIDIEYAVRKEDGLYWESTLPKFEIGDAIQRYEVETGVSYNSVNFDQAINRYRDDVSNRFQQVLNKLVKDSIAANGLDETILNTEKSIDAINLFNKVEADSFITKTEFDRIMKELKSTIERQVRYMYANEEVAKIISIRSDSSIQRDRLSALIDTLRVDSVYPIESLNSALQMLSPEMKAKPKIDTAQLRSVKNSLKQLDDTYRKLQLDGIRVSTKNDYLTKYVLSSTIVQDSLKRRLLHEIYNPNFSGAGIQQSDIKFDEHYKNVSILYRNYRGENRSLVALDPAEKLSIFRVRYVPFPVVGNKLYGPAHPEAPPVFEIGVTFGNQVIASNEYVKPEFSIQRLGIAVAVTPKLFQPDAEIQALLLTYDFNAYASIGIGANFGTLKDDKGRMSYLSFGINQRAFRALLNGIGQLVTSSDND
ncbi:MAG: hypothetical protein RIF46_00310 [Cyclobacteriaceae bacterium]